MVPGMEKSSANTTPVVNSTLETNEGAQARKNDFNYRSVIVSLNFLTNSTRPKAQLSVHQCAQFIAYPGLLHNQAVKRVLEYLKVTATKGLILKPDS